MTPTVTTYQNDYFFHQMYWWLFEDFEFYIRFHFSFIKNRAQFILEPIDTASSRTLQVSIGSATQGRTKAALRLQGRKRKKRRTKIYKLAKWVGEKFRRSGPSLITCSGRIHFLAGYPRLLLRDPRKPSRRGREIFSVSRRTGVRRWKAAGLHLSQAHQRLKLSSGRAEPRRGAVH